MGPLGPVGERAARSPERGVRRPDSWVPTATGPLDPATSRSRVNGDWPENEASTVVVWPVRVTVGAGTAPSGDADRQPNDTRTAPNVALSVAKNLDRTSETLDGAIAAPG